MKRNFLILMLLSLLPLAGWAAKTNISDFTVTLSSETPLVYNGSAQTLPTLTSISKGATTISDFLSNWTTAWSYRGETVTQGTNAGVYTLTITADESNAEYTGSVTKSFTISKKDVTVTAKDPSSITYGQAAPAATQFYEVATGTNGYIEGHAYSGDPVTISEISYATAGDKTFTITAKENIDNYNIVVPAGQNSGTLKINKVALEVQAKDFADFVYGAKQASDITKEVTYSGFVNGESESVLGGTLSFKVNTAADGSGTEFAGYGSAATYYIIPSGYTSSNYDISFVNSDFTVSKKSFTSAAADFTVTGLDDVTYNKTAQAAVPAITYGSIPLVAPGAGVTNNDYTIAYKNSSDGVIEASTIINAGTYKVVITAAGSSNYDGSMTKEFKINKKQLNIKSKDQTKEYDAKVFTFPDVTSSNWSDFLTISGLVDGDNYGNIFADANYKVQLTCTNTLVGNHTITVGSTIADDEIFTNYKPKYGSLGKLNITPRTLYIQAKNQSKDYGAEVPAKYNGTTVVEAADVIVGSSNTLTSGQISADASVLQKNSSSSQDAISVYPKLTKAAGTAAGTDYTITIDVTGMKIKNGETDVTECYDIQGINGVYKFNAIAFTIWADPKTSVYGKDLVPLTATLESENMSEEDAAALVADVNYALEVANASDAKKYDITLNTTKLNDKIANGANKELWKNYKTSAEDIDFVSDIYEITKAPVKVIANPQVRMVGEIVIAEASAETVSFEAVEGNVIPTNDTDKNKIYTALALAYNVTSGVLVKDGTENTDIDNSTDKLVAHALTHGTVATGTPVNGEYYNGITITGIDAYNAAANNFTLTAVAGKLTATTDVVIELDTKAENNTATLNANAGKKLNVKIKNKSMTAGQWYSISLPFDITPFEFCNTVGSYAVFDRLSTTSDNVNFKISLDPIPAYTPFLVKVQSDVSLKAQAFEKVTIVAPTTIDTEKNNAWKVVNTIDQATLSTEDVPYYCWIEAKDSKDGISLGWNDGTEERTAVRGFNAYIVTLDGQAPATAPVLTIEEADGSTTAIAAIAADGALIPAEGWYTLNGIKLNGMPTQKGVYINNGKKIVVK